jgi:hypothetical protein
VLVVVVGGGTVLVVELVVVLLAVVVDVVVGEPAPGFRVLSVVAGGEGSFDPFASLVFCLNLPLPLPGCSPPGSSAVPTDFRGLPQGDLPAFGSSGCDRTYSP